MQSLWPAAEEMPTCAPSPLACQVSMNPEWMSGRRHSSRLPRSGGCGVRQICSNGGAMERYN